MKSMQTMKAAAAALALLGTAALATPSQAAVISASAKSTLASVAANPTANEKAILKLMEQVAPGSTLALLTLVRTAPDAASLAASVEAYTALNPSLQAVIEDGVAAFV